MAAKDELGKLGEQLAADYLRDVGLQIIDRNWRCRAGEIDIVARDGDVLVVVEVKTRSGTSHGTPLGAVSAKKALRLRRLAAHWLGAQYEWFRSVRIDVLAVQRVADGRMSIKHVPGVL
ncbi:YraN family protein [Rhizohabitans arisaemae]|uniref:YraN family protein n=1 Tax=Rhizohabitans arisaemae TaxID=2720610 RepID=UPI0024B21044|nr:YraN family protein [Rhizohabitans arisaemae]